jgi:glyoxylase-like metal-dependent hydrolase (beta-lactamase superfamily II)
VHAPGHTPGHLTVSIANGGDRLIYLTDLVHHHGVMLPHPNFHVSLDTDPEAGVRARQDWFSRFVTDRALVAGAHLPFPALGHLRQMNGGATWVPAEWRW